MNSTKPSITPAPNGPYLVSQFSNLRNSTGPIEAKGQIALCRCGGSANKPFCDGTHSKNGFSDAKLDGRTDDKRENYQGKQITIHDNRGICAHAGRCTNGLASVFRLNQEPWIDSDGASRKKIIDTIKQCPSGALSFSVNGQENIDQADEPGIMVAKNGPYVVTGGLELVGVTPGEGASKVNFTLCRCGGSKNKPFCDGTHWQIKFQDDKN